jgi:hypothetical protein
MNRGIVRLLVVVAAVSCVLLPASVGNAETTLETVQSGTLTMASDPGDYVGQGRSYSFATPGNLFFARSDEGGSQITVTVRPDAVDPSYWGLQFAAPWGQQLVPGTYTGVQRASSRTSGAPGLDVYGEFRACGALTGTFTVLDVSYEPSGYVDSFHATFEEHCGSLTPALRGEVQVTNPPPPPPIAAQITLDGSAQLAAHGAARVQGTISCNRDPDPNMSTIQISLSEPTKGATVTGAIAISLPSCPATPIPWTATVPPTDPKHPFDKGSASLTTLAALRDPFYGEYVYGDPVTGNASLKNG